MKNIQSIEVFSLILESDFLVKSILIFLLFSSIWSWAIVFDKIFKFRILKTKTEHFNKLFWSGQTLEEIYRKIKNNNKFPFANIFCSVMEEWSSANLPSIMSNGDKKVSFKERLSNIIEISGNKSLIKLKYGLNFLLTIGTTGTFFGLFGTVWGIMNSFRSIASLKDTNLAVIAPGITSALITTIVGLSAAIPAIIFFNHYSNKINMIEEEIDNFSLELLNILSKELDK